MANFYPRPPRGGRLDKSQAILTVQDFYPRPPRGGRPLNWTSAVRSKTKISIHALREEGDIFPAGVDSRGNISIHALREEGDDGCQGLAAAHLKFLSTPSARRATERLDQYVRCRWHFYPRPPRGGRLTSRMTSTIALSFLSTPSARRATPLPLRQGCGCGISIHALREEGDFFCQRFNSIT